MNFLVKIKQHAAPLAHIDNHSSALGFVINKGEKYAGAYAFGFIKAYYRERAMVKGIPADIIAGGILSLLAAGLEIWSKGKSRLAPHLNAFGDAGVMSFFGSLGAHQGVKSSGRQVLVLKAGQTAPAAIPAGYDAVGAIPPASDPNSFLSAADINRYCESR